MHQTSQQRFRLKCMNRDEIVEKKKEGRQGGWGAGMESENEGEGRLEGYCWSICDG